MSSSGAPSSGGSFSIDLERAPSAITELEAARDELTAIRDQAFRLGTANPGSADSVSIDAARALSDVAVSGADSFVAAMTAGIAQVQHLIDTMKRDLADHEAAEEQGAATFR